MSNVKNYQHRQYRDWLQCVTEYCSSKENCGFQGETAYISWGAASILVTICFIFNAGTYFKAGSVSIRSLQTGWDKLHQNNKKYFMFIFLCSTNCPPPPKKKKNDNMYRANIRNPKKWMSFLLCRLFLNVLGGIWWRELGWWENASAVLSTVP